jgi:hypothetical protein
MTPFPSRAPRRAFFALAALRVITWALDLGEPYLLPLIARRFELPAASIAASRREPGECHGSVEASRAPG